MLNYATALEADSLGRAAKTLRKARGGTRERQLAFDKVRPLHGIKSSCVQLP